MLTRHHGSLPVPTNERPYRAASATGPELVHEITKNGRQYRATLRQIGWHGQSGAFYALDDDVKPHHHEPGSFSPLYVVAHMDEIADGDHVPAGDQQASSADAPDGARLEVLHLPDREQDGRTLSPFALILSGLTPVPKPTALEALTTFAAQIGAEGILITPHPITLL